MNFTNIEGSGTTPKCHRGAFCIEMLHPAWPRVSILHSLNRSAQPVRRDASLGKKLILTRARDGLSGELRTQQKDPLIERSPVLTQDSDPQIRIV